MSRLSDMSSLYFLIPTVIIILLVMPIFLEVRLSFNLLDKSGVFCIYLFRKKLQYFKFEIDGREIKLKDEEETKEKQIDFDSPEIALYEEFSTQIKDKTRLRFIEVFYNVGLNDAFLTSMVCGVINIAVLIFFTSLKNKKPTASLQLYNTSSFNKKVANLATVINLSISLFDVVYSFIISVILSKKKNERNEKLDVMSA